MKHKPVSDDGRAGSPRPTLYKSQFTVPFFWADPAGILFFGNIHAAAHHVWEKWALEKSGLWDLWFSNSSGLAYPVRSVSADFLRPMKYGVTFLVEVTLESVSDSTFVLRTQFSLDTHVHAVVQSVHTAIHLESCKKAALGAKWKEHLHVGRAE